MPNSTKRHTLRLYTPDGRNLFRFRIPMSDAKKPVTLQREEIDVYRGKPGLAVECMNAQCGMRLSNAFSHPVHMIEFTDTRAFVVDKLNADGTPRHCIRYYHHEGDEQKEFDQPGGKKRLLQEGRVKKTFQLLVPTASTKHLPNPNRKPRSDAGQPRNTAKKPRLSFARISRAGLVKEV